MSYRRALLRRWSTQDWFAVITIAMTVAFLTGAGLVVDATATRTTEIAAGQSSPASASWYEDPETGRTAADAGSLVLPVARVQVDGQPALVVGLPEDASAVAEHTAIAIPDPPPAGDLQHPTVTGPITVQGQSATHTATSRPVDRSILSPLWYQAQEDTVKHLGVTDTLVVDPANGGTPLTGALAFFVAGARSALSLFGLLAGGGAVLLGVVTFGITRVTVRERLQTIRTIRATGGTPRTILGLFGLRAAVQTAVGVLVGYAVGIVLTNAAVSVAIFAGHPVALSTRVSSRLAIVLLPLYAGLIIVGGLGGLLAARQVATTPPLEISASTSPAVHDERNSVLAPISGHLSRFSPDLLGWRAVLPTAVTLAVFLAFAIAAFSTYGALAPLASGQDVAITESTATHPISSQVSVSYAAALEKQGIDASPEILLLAVTDGQPYVARGASFGAFASLAEAELVRGHPPANPSDAVIGSDLARTVDVSVGDTLTVGGSTQSAITRVHITGVFDAREPYDDQLITSLQTARHLSTVHPGEVNLIRVERLPDTSDRVSVLGIDAPGEVPADDSITMDVAVMNPTAVNQSRTVAVSFGDRTEAQRVTLPPGERQTVTFTFPTGSPREATIALDNTTQQVQVVAADALRIANLPTQAPPGSHPQITVTTISGEAVANAALTLGNETRRTDAAGTVRVPLQQEGVATLAIRKGTRRVNATVRVREDVPRRLLGSLSVEPRRPTVVTSPTAHLSLQNPWDEPLTRSVTILRPNGTTASTVALEPRETTTLSTALPQRSPGTYEVSARTETTLATGSYEVGGDPRLSASIAATGQGAPASGFGKAAQAVFGNLELLVGVLLLLVGLMTVGATTAAFAGAVHARKRTLGIHRAVGASPWQVLRIVLADAAVVGIVATGLGLMGAVGALWILDAADLLTVYGVRLVSMLSMRAVLAPASIALVLAITGAIGATWRILRTSPSDLLGARQIDTPPEKKDNQQSPHSAGDPSPEQRTHQGDQTQGEEGEDA